MQWHEYFFKLVSVIKLKSKDRSTKVGCVIVGPHNEIISTGFNGLPIGVPEYSERQVRKVRYLYYEHSERNAVYLAARRGVSLEGAKIYLEWFPCADCARAIIQSGIIEVWIDGRKYDPFHPTATDKRWAESIAASKEMLHEAKVMINLWTGPDKVMRL